MWLLRRRHRLRVTGESMLPYLPPGQEVLILPRRGETIALAVGDVVVLAHPLQPQTTIVKRVAQIQADGRLFLLGDNPAASTDSRTFGPVSPQQIQGRVVCLFP